MLTVVKLTYLSRVGKKKELDSNDSKELNYYPNLLKLCERRMRH